MPLRVIITAAASGIGLVIARAFAAQGHEVCVCDVDSAAVEALSSSHPSLRATYAEVGDPQAVERWVDGALDGLGGVDVVVNNAGIAGPIGAIETVAHEDWSRCLAICLDSHYLVCKRTIPYLKAQRSGCIINLSSTAGLFGYPFRTPYAAAKWAVIGLTKSLAAELGPFDVRANAICPGSVAGERMTRVINAEANQRGSSPEAVRAEYTAGQSIRRFVEPAEVADLCLFLSSPAGKMITGQAIAVDGHTETFHTF